MLMTNLDPKTVEGFGAEWKAFDQAAMSEHEAGEIYNQYFAVFPWHLLPPDATGFDLGCGSGRWARFVARRVGKLHCIDASSVALEVARRNLRCAHNCEFHLASVDAMPIGTASMDFGYSLGVLHHVPDTAAAIESCASRLKPGAPLLLYLYYALENRPRWYRALWKATNVSRRGISRLPHRIRLLLAAAVACMIYVPLARGARLAETVGRSVESWPLAYYRHRSVYTMRTDALDRFGTRLEQRFTREEIATMMHAAGLRDVTFSERPPYWCAVGFQSAS